MFQKAKPYVLSILLALGVGSLSALLTAQNQDLYSEIVMPPLAPPGWLFPVVWTILYILMGIASYLVLTSGKSEENIRRTLILYGIQLAFNFLWPIFFFNFGWYLFSFFWLHTIQNAKTVA